MLAILNCPYPSNIFTKLESYCFSDLKKLSFKKNLFFFLIQYCHCNQTKWSLVIKHINWVENYQMIITAKYGSHHFTGYGENAI